MHLLKQQQQQQYQEYLQYQQQYLNQNKRLATPHSAYNRLQNQGYQQNQQEIAHSQTHLAHLQFIQQCHEKELFEQQQRHLLELQSQQQIYQSYLQKSYTEANTQEGALPYENDLGLYQ